MTIQNILAVFLDGCTRPLVLLWVAFLVAAVAIGLHCAFSHLMRKYGKPAAVFMLSVALFSAVVADKPDTGGTNAPPNGVSGTNVVEQTGGDGTNDTGGVAGPLMAGRRMMSTLSSLTPNDGPMVEPFAVRPANAVENAWWRARGAHMDGLTIPALGWSFRTPAGFLDSLLVYSYGEIQPDVETAYFPRPFPEADLSLLPEGRWGMLPHEGAESLFWHATSPSNSLILTWQNAAYDRDANCPTNLQIELFSNGTYVYRYDDHTEHHAVIYPFDLDGDGLENSVDPDPLTPGNDAHGTNAEWYDLVCSDVFSKTEQPNSLPIPLPGGESVFFKPGVNTNAYYFVDVVAERGPAPIYFNSSHPGRLGSPVVVALAGETNRVPLLVGATYSVTSDVPFTVACSTNGFAEAAWDDGVNATVRWPLNFTFTEEISGTGRSYTVGVEPFDPGGTFSWGHSHGGATLQNADPPLGGGSCGCVSGNGTTVTFGCSSSCTCGGNCLAVGAYNFEHALFAVTGGVCRCGFDDPPPAETPGMGPLDGPLITVDFSAPAVIFEDAYVDSIDELRGTSVTQPLRSSRTRLTVSAWGGPNGGTLNLASQNLGKLAPVACGPILLPSQPVELVPFQRWTVSFLCEGMEESSDVGDVFVSGTVTDAVSGVVCSDRSELTIMRIELTAKRTAPQNSAGHRHTYGIGEHVYFQSHPSCFLGQTTLTGEDGVVGPRQDGLDGLEITWGVANVNHSLNVTFMGVSCRPLVQVLFPSGIEGFNPRYEVGPVLDGQVGGICLLQQFRVKPLTVSFFGIAVEEVPCYNEITPDTYFLNLLRYEQFASILHRSHTRAAGAGKWFTVVADNIVGGQGTFDRAGMEGVFPRMRANGVPTLDPSVDWAGGGSLVWRIPFGWNVDQPTGSTADPIGFFAEEARQVIRVSNTGTFSVHKLGHVAERTLNGDSRVYSESGTGNGTN